MTLRDSFLAGQGIPIIDVHTHMGPFRSIYMPDAPVDKMIEGMNRAGIESIWCSPHSALSGDVREGNKEVAAAAEHYPGRVYGYCTINPNYPEDIERELDTYMARPDFIGIKIHPSMHEVSVTDSAYALMWERANREQWIVLSHTWGLSGGCGVYDMREIANRYPDVRLLLGHSCYGAWCEVIALAAAFPHVYLELCAAYHVYGLIEAMCREAGSHKVLYGTDYPWFDPMVVAGCVTFAHIEEDAMRNILYNNAKRLFMEQIERKNASAVGR